MVSAEVKANAMKVMQAIKELREADPEMKRRFRVLVTTAGDPMPWANFVKEQGMIWMHVFPGVLHRGPLQEGRRARCSSPPATRAVCTRRGSRCTA